MKKEREKMIKIIEKALIVSRKKLNLAEIRKDKNMVDHYNQTTQALENILHAYKNIENETDRRRYLGQVDCCTK